MSLDQPILVESAAIPYLMRIPPGSNIKPQPLLLFLHGYGEGPPTEIRRGLCRHGPLRPGNEVASLDEFIIVAPQLPQRGDNWYLFAEPVRDIVSQVQRQHGGDHRRTYLTGFSFGANGVFDLAVQQPEIWAALWAVDPTRVPAEKPRCPIWFCFGDIARYRKEDFVRALTAGSNARGGEIETVVQDDGDDHVGSARRAYANDQIYSWLLTKSLCQ